MSYSTLTRFHLLSALYNLPPLTSLSLEESPKRFTNYLCQLFKISILSKSEFSIKFPMQVFQVYLLKTMSLSPLPLPHSLSISSFLTLSRGPEQLLILCNTRISKFLEESYLAVANLAFAAQLFNRGRTPHFVLKIFISSSHRKYVYH